MQIKTFSQVSETYFDSSNADTNSRYIGEEQLSADRMYLSVVQRVKLPAEEVV